MKEEFLAIIERTLDEVLPKEGERPAELSEAMRYAVGTGGKRIRPLICLASAVAVGGKAEDARYPAAAIELLHNYTLVHDDLPAMDKRSRPRQMRRATSRKLSRRLARQASALCRDRSRT